MKNIFKFVSFFILIIFFTGCETVHQTTQQAGTYVGQGAKAVGGVTEGVTQGYAGDSQGNPYGR